MAEAFVKTKRSKRAKSFKLEFHDTFSKNQRSNIPLKEVVSVLKETNNFMKTTPNSHQLNSKLRHFLKSEKRYRETSQSGCQSADFQSHAKILCKKRKHTEEPTNKSKKANKDGSAVKVTKASTQSTTRLMRKQSVQSFCYELFGTDSKNEDENVTCAKVQSDTKYNNEKAISFKKPNSKKRNPIKPRSSVSSSSTLIKTAGAAKKSDCAHTKAVHRDSATKKSFMKRKQDTQKKTAIKLTPLPF